MNDPQSVRDDRTYGRGGKPGVRMGRHMRVFTNPQVADSWSRSSDRWAALALSALT